MQLGFYTPEIALPTVDAVFGKAAALGFTQVQYDFITSHGEEMPEAFHEGELDEVRAACAKHGIAVTAINGTFNMVDRDEERLETYIRRFERIAQACNALGCRIITLCTGSKHPDSMWRYHPDSQSEAAWEQLLAVTRRILPIAERYDVLLGVETEASNVVCTIERTRRYLDEIDSPRLGVIMDCANLFPAGTAHADNVRPTIEKAFALLGKDVILAHGKDICEGDAIKFAAPGGGIVDYDFYFSKLKEIGYDGGLILHGLHAMEEFEPSIKTMKEKLAASGL
jgi:sugar phosphate isomerase/epimerase